MSYDTYEIQPPRRFHQRHLEKIRTHLVAIKTFWMKRMSATSNRTSASVAAWSSKPLIERQHSEAIERASEARFRDLFEMTSDWFWEQDARFRFTYFSTGWLRQTLIPPIAPLGKTFWELHGIRLTPEQWAAHRKVLNAHQPFQEFEYCIHTAAGEEYWFSVSGQPLFDQIGRFSGYRGISRDITEQRLAAAASGRGPPPSLEHQQGLPYA